MVESGEDASNDLHFLKVALLHLSLYVERRELSKSSLMTMIGDLPNKRIN